jgi:1,4-dihydroxy-2-naphthoyl-CoA synthase
MQQATLTQAFETIFYEEKGTTAYVTLNRPKVLNALNQKAIAELKTAFEDARNDPGVRGVVTGAATKHSSQAPPSASWREQPRSRRNGKPATVRPCSTSSRTSASR